MVKSNRFHHFLYYKSSSGDFINLYFKYAGSNKLMKKPKSGPRINIPIIVPSLNGSLILYKKHITKTKIIEITSTYCLIL